MLSKQPLYRYTCIYVSMLGWIPPPPQNLPDALNVEDLALSLLIYPEGLLLPPFCHPQYPVQTWPSASAIQPAVTCPPPEMQLCLLWGCMSVNTSCMSELWWHYLLHCVCEQGVLWHLAISGEMQRLSDIPKKEPLEHGGYLSLTSVLVLVHHFLVWALFW